MPRTRIPLLLCLLFVTLVSALEVTVDSPCASQCLDDLSKGNASDPQASLTFNRDLFCYDWEVDGSNSTVAGRKFKDCNNCLKSSGYVSTKVDERDVMWFVFNNRGVVDWCLFGRFAEESNPNITSSSIYKTCNSNCNKLYTAADYTIKSNLDSYSFCAQDGNFTTNAESCLTCLYNTPGLTMLGNVLATIVDVCKKTPINTYDFPKDQELYGRTKINLSGTRATPSANSSASASPSSSKSPESSTGLSKGALAGIVLGALVVIILVLVGILLLFRRRKNKNKAMAVTQGNSALHGIGGNNYQYSPVDGVQKDRYAQQPVEMEQHSRTELSGQSRTAELSAGARGRY